MRSLRKNRVHLHRSTCLAESPVKTLLICRMSRRSWLPAVPVPGTMQLVHQRGHRPLSLPLRPLGDSVKTSQDMRQANGLEVGFLKPAYAGIPPDTSADHPVLTPQLPLGPAGSPTNMVEDSRPHVDQGMLRAPCSVILRGAGSQN